ncbi:MAG: transposase [Parahaliea sp.]
MENYKKGAYTVWDCKYHLVWTTKYHYEVLSGDVWLRCRALLREIARSVAPAYVWPHINWAGSWRGSFYFYSPKYRPVFV